MIIPMLYLSDDVSVADDKLFTLILLTHPALGAAFWRWPAVANRVLCEAVDVAVLTRRRAAISLVSLQVGTSAFDLDPREVSTALIRPRYTNSYNCTSWTSHSN